MCARAHGGDESASADDWPDDYRQQFWTAYPHQVSEKRALAALDRLRRKHAKPTWSDLMGALRRYANYNRWLGLKFTNPTTWLVDERWNDRPAS